VDVRAVVHADGRRTARERVNGVPVARVGTVATLASQPVSPGLSRALRAEEPDLVHLHWPNPGAALAWLASGHRGPLVVTYHSDVVRQRLLGRALAALTHHVLARASAILVSSPGYLSSSPVLRAHAARCHVVPFGIDAARFGRPDPAQADAIRARFGPRIVLGAGRLVSYKGFRYLVRAMREVDATLVIAGDGPERASLERAAREDGVEGRVHFAGAVPDLAPWYHAADVFAFPSVARSEAFGLVQLEAMACGLPVVNTALDTGVPFVSQHGVTGLTVPPADPAALAAALRRLLDDPALREAYGRAGAHRAREELTERRMLGRTLALYRTAAGLPGAR
jgi:rhamnosyl/mannosyltransferase